MSINYKSKAVLVSALVALIGIALLFTISSYRNEPVLSLVDTNSSTPTGGQEVKKEPSGKNFGVSPGRDSAITAQILASQDPGRHTSYITTLMEIAARIPEGQFIEGENELRALYQLIDPLSDAGKYAFLEYFIDYSQNNIFNSEVVTAFDALWSSLEIDARTKLLSAQLLASHYSSSYEFALALNQFDNLSQLGANLDAGLHRDMAYAQFGLGLYPEAVPNLVEHIELQTAQGMSVNRREYSMLFESYYRTNNIEEAEQIGMLLLEHYNDLQDWKDMQQFYEATRDDAGLESLLTRASQFGLLNENGQWLD